VTPPALILQHGRTGPPGLLGEWCEARDVEFEVFDSSAGGDWPELGRPAFLACLGARNSVLETHVPAVAATIRTVEQAVRESVPVLGLCYGGQVLAKVLGGDVEPSPEPQHGWYTVQTSAPEIVAEGPWLEWHYDRFTLPPGAAELARTGTTLQAFSQGPHLGTQFHPESTLEIVTQWARSDTDHLAQIGITDGEARLHPGSDFTTVARDAAVQLFDAFWESAHTHERSES
jgi:GMP synthase-like glutamine amidotransferase